MDVMFSVIVPVYNVREYLRRCTDSILCQSCGNFEIILVDDGSTDGSGTLCDELAEQYPGISVVHKANGGLASARNTGLEAASGKYVAFVDSDDWIEPDMLDTLACHIADQDVDVLTFGYRKRRGSEILTEGSAAFPEGRYDKENVRNRILADSIARERAFDQVKLPSQLSACMCVYNRAFLERYSIRFESEREVLNEDWMFNIRCYARAESVEVLHRYFYNYDTREGSLSQSYKRDAFTRKKRLYSRYMEVLQESGNLNKSIENRLRNFWLEAVYDCMIIEFYSPDWKIDGVDRIKKISGNSEFITGLNQLNKSNSSTKGLLFKTVVKTEMYGFLRFVYLHKGIFGR